MQGGAGVPGDRAGCFRAQQPTMATPEAPQPPPFSTPFKTTAPVLVAPLLHHLALAACTANAVAQAGWHPAARLARARGGQARAAGAVLCRGGQQPAGKRQQLRSLGSSVHLGCLRMASALQHRPISWPQSSQQPPQQQYHHHHLRPPVPPGAPHQAAAPALR